MAAKNTYRNNTTKKSNGSRRKIRLSLNFFTDRRFHLSLGFLFLGIAVFLLTAFISFIFTGKADQSVVEAILVSGIRESGLEAENWLGMVGAVVSHYFIYHWFGISAFFIPPFLFIVGFKFVSKRSILPVYSSLKFILFFTFWICLLFGYTTLNVDNFTGADFLSGGFGFELAVLFHSLIGWGTYLFLLLSFLIFIIYFFNITEIMGFLKQTMTHPEESGINRDNPEELPGDASGNEEGRSHELEIMDSLEAWKSRKASGNLAPDGDENGLDLSIEDQYDKAAKRTATTGRDEEPEFIVEDTEDRETAIDRLENYDPTLDLGTYRYPTLELLNDYDQRGGQVTKEELEQNKDKIIETLINFKIGITSIKATIGPTVTLYEIVPDAGVKISKIKNLEDDIALSLSALGIRIIAPIPGKGTIGIEVPNKNKTLVSIRSVLATEKFQQTNYELPIVLGRTISNEVYLADLTKMPHLLIAGATGQGKSVGINVILTSLIYKKHPSHLKFVLVDPKKVELTLYNKLERHFLAELPNSEEAIVTDTKKVIYTLNSLSIEMDNRYNLLKEGQCRNLKEYNDKFISRRLNPNKGHRYMPYIVLVIDELADLMLTAGKEIETPIARLAQLARAIGIHLVVATQRPDVKVITGTIKVNFPARISYKVVSKLDSRIILDTGGADQLVGMGDMLMSFHSDIIRLQSPYIETREVEKICDYVGSQRGYPSAYLLPEYEGDESGEMGEVDLGDRDSLFDDAARLIVLHQQGSTSLIQRKLKLGYNRAGRLIDQLEAAGIVGPFEGSKAREVLVKDAYALEQLLRELDEIKD
ncbi:MAG: DNA translocase FtsK [Cyclobacteriaceae bacterium]|nr:DNA translocase FtsK [Cyclobacteriaceae bacterium]